MITNIGLSQEIFAISLLKTLKSYLKHRRKHMFCAGYNYRGGGGGGSDRVVVPRYLMGGIVHSLSSGKVAATPILKSVPSQFSPFILKITVSWHAYKTILAQSRPQR